VREVREELGIILNQSNAKKIYQAKREETQDFYDVWLFHADIDISEIDVQETEVVGVQWVNRDVLFDMLHSGKLHPMIDYIEEIF
jgi:8-oxo-dGTP pyrophosphatase MutT (NUDIX family)